MLPRLPHIPGNLPVAPIASGLAGFGLMHVDARHVDRQMMNAQLMNQAIRELEAMRMGPTIHAFKYASDQTAIHVGQRLARSLAGAEPLQKEAFIAGAVGLGARALGAGMRMGGRGLGQLGRAGSAGQGGAGLGGLLRQGGIGLQRQGRKAQQWGQSWQQNAQLGSAGKPLIGWGTKAKLLGGAGLLGAGYLGMKTLQAGRDYMMQPSGTPTYGYGPQVRQGISQYGY